MVLDLLCYIIAAVLWAIAAFAPPVPGWDRTRFAAAGLLAFIIPAIVHVAR